MLENLKQSIEHLNRAIENFEEADANFKGIESNEYFKLMPSEKPAEVKKLWAIRHACRATLITAISLISQDGISVIYNFTTTDNPLVYYYAPESEVSGD